MSVCNPTFGMPCVIKLALSRAVLLGGDSAMPFVPSSLSSAAELSFLSFHVSFCSFFFSSHHCGDSVHYVTVSVTVTSLFKFAGIG